jgi:hypothetical protein
MPNGTTAAVTFSFTSQHCVEDDEITVGKVVTFEIGIDPKSGTARQSASTWCDGSLKQSINQSSFCTP